MHKFTLKRIIAEKLGLNPKSVRGIIKNEELCNRILAEPVQSLTEYCKTSNIPVSTIKVLARKGVISAFGNTHWTKGSKMFVFPKELEEFEIPEYSKVTLWKKIRQLAAPAMNMLPPQDAQMLKRVLRSNTRETLNLINEEEVDKALTASSTLLDWPIAALSLSTKPQKLMKELDIHYLKDLIVLSESDILKHKGVGVKAVHEIQTKLKSISNHLQLKTT